LLITDLGVTITICACIWLTCWLSYLMYKILTLQHRWTMWSCNNTNSVMITIVPELMLIARIWNNNVFSTLVFITINIGLLFYIIASNTGFCNPRNCVLVLYMSFNACWILTVCNFFHCYTCTLFILSLTNDCFCLVRPWLRSARHVNTNSKNWCHCWLICRNRSWRLIIVLFLFINLQA
jgi:hypothetical protein